MEASDFDGTVRVWQAANVGQGKPPTASQRQGVGSRLMRYALDSAHASGISSFSLWTDCENTSARKLYEVLGMKPTRARRVSETVEWVRYELDLESATI